MSRTNAPSGTDFAIGCGFYGVILGFIGAGTGITLADRAEVGGYVTTEWAWNGLFIGAMIGGAIALAGHARRHVRAMEAREAEERKQAEHSARMRLDDVERRQREAQQRQQRGHSLAQDIVGQALILLELLPAHLTEANADLDVAKRQFNDGAFVPFWSAIEKAAVNLGRIKETVVSLDELRERHWRVCSEYSVETTFPTAAPIVSATALQVAVIATNRMDELVTRAHRDHRFASIYLQMRTNAILLAGFTTLGEALDGLAKELTMYLHSIAGVFERELGEVSEVLRGIAASSSRALVEHEAIHSALQRAEGHATDRERKIIGMLDNIQRGYRPLI